MNIAHLAKEKGFRDTKVMEFSPDSQDINPIEYLQSIIKQN